MRKIYGLATLLGVAAGAAYYLTKVGALTVNDEEQEDGSKRFTVEVKLPKNSAPAAEAEEEEVEETAEGEEDIDAAVEDFAEEDGEEEEERKIGFTFEIGADTNEKLNAVKEKAAEWKNNTVEAAKGLKASFLETVSNFMNRGKEEAEEADGIEETFEEVAEEFAEAVEDAVEEIKEEAAFEMDLPEIEQEMPEVDAPAADED